MNRLTKRATKGFAYLVNVKDDEQDIACKSRNTAQCIMDSWERLAAYEDAEEQGRLVVPVRCKDCENYKAYTAWDRNASESIECHECALLSRDLGDDGYCSRGERRDGGERDVFP